ncbi:MAG: hypothetical protein ACM3JB_04545 [Acidobacteriaceae bacterium]
MHIEFAIRRGERRALRFRPEPPRPARFFGDAPSHTGYNPLQPMLKVLRVSSVLLVCLAAYAARATGKWDAQTFELARKIFALAGSGPASFNFQNNSSLPPDAANAIRRSIQDGLRASGVQFRDAAPTSIKVILSENIRGYLWLADVREGSDSKVAMISVPRDDTSSALTSPLVLRRSFLIAEQDQILDVALWQAHDQRFLLVLTPSQVNILRQNAAHWDTLANLAIPHETYPRDLRGRLWVGRDGDWKAFLPGIECSGPEQLKTPMTCHESDDPWPLNEKIKGFYNASRNYFTGALVPPLPKPLPPFYAVTQPVKDGSLWVYTTLDGQVMSYDDATTRAVANARDFGSDIVSVRSNCASGMQLLATAAGDDQSSDTVRAFEIDNQDLRPVSPPLAFDGPLTALWTTMDGDSAIAVLRTQTESYEAYSISVACSQ